MPHFLLIGAGFSRNWGGWLANEVFEYLLGCPEIQNNNHLKQLLWKYQYREPGGFEYALDEVQQSHHRNRQDNGVWENLKVFQSAIDRMFADMNRGYETISFEFQQDRKRSVVAFLKQFDAIYSLNQDLLLEQHYIDNIPLSDPLQRFQNGGSLPGMRRYDNQAYPNPANWAQYNWYAADKTEFRIENNYQPIFKLHGSSNWRGTPESAPLIIAGGSKGTIIELHPILSWYFRQFKGHLAQPNARLMVMGYGFRDPHINHEIIHAVKNHGLSFFVIDPAGADVGRNANRTNRAPIFVPTELDEAFSSGLIGASRRSLREIFVSDFIEYQKIQRFFTE